MKHEGGSDPTTSCVAFQTAITRAKATATVMATATATTLATTTVAATATATRTECADKQAVTA